MRSKAWLGTSTNSDGKGGSATSEGRRRGWVLTATSWDSIFGDPLSKPEWMPCGRKRDGDAVESLGGGGGGR